MDRASVGKGGRHRHYDAVDYSDLVDNNSKRHYADRGNWEAPNIYRDMGRVRGHGAFHRGINRCGRIREMNTEIIRDLITVGRTDPKGLSGRIRHETPDHIAIGRDFLASRPLGSHEHGTKS